MLKLHSIPLSHSALTARLMIEHKGLEYEVVEHLSGLHPLMLRLHGFRGGTVPAIRLDGRRVQGSLAISEALEERWPEPALFPEDPEARRRVRAAEVWGARELQPVPRRLFRWAALRYRSVRRDLARVNGLPLPGLMAPLLKPLVLYFARLSHADDRTVRADLAHLPALLDRVDAWIAEGLLGGETAGAADYQIGPSVRLLSIFEDLRPAVEGRPALELARKLLPSYGARVPPVFPAAWLAPLRR